MDNRVVAKLTSRKFWAMVAAFLSSIGASLVGYFSDNETLATVGVVCTMLSAAIYAASEAYVDAASAAANTTSTSVSASSTNAKVVEKALTGTSATDGSTSVNA